MQTHDRTGIVVALLDERAALVSHRDQIAAVIGDAHRHVAAMIRRFLGNAGQQIVEALPFLGRNENSVLIGEGQILALLFREQVDLVVDLNAGDLAIHNLRENLVDGLNLVVHLGR